MKQFINNILATVLGIFIAGIIIIMTGVFGISNLLNHFDSNTKIHENSIFILKLQGKIVERYHPNPLNQLLEESVSTSGLDDILASIRKAKDNENIKGIYIETGTLYCPIASLQEIRNALIDFKKSGKFIIAYGGYYTQGAYYVASTADKLIVNPSGNISWQGLSTQTLFIKDLLNKAGIKMQIFRAGTYKSAVEPFISTEMSAANKEQTRAFTQTIWNQLISDIAISRDLSETMLNKLADQNISFQPAESYIENGLADTLLYKDQAINYLKQLLKLSPDAKLHTLTLEDMISVTHNIPKFKSNNIIAVYYAQGEIDANIGNSYNEGINSEKVITDLRKLRENSNVKAVVLRINSPGGSAYGAEQIWREVSLLKNKKPVIVSMGDYAASGGYYIACAANRIIAHPGTLTGSIGVFGMIPDISELMNEKLGLHMDGVKTNRMSDIGNINRPMAEEEKKLIQQQTNKGYELFVRRCAEGRNIPIEDIKRIAEGRVWTGSMAEKLKLVDELGGIDKALRTAIQMANVKEYTISSYPQKEKFLTGLMNIHTDTDRYIRNLIQNKFGNYYEAFFLLENINSIDKIQARMPFLLDIR